MTDLPRLVITGAAGFVGRRLIDALTGRWRIEAIDIAPPAQGPLVQREGLRWHALDINDRWGMARLFSELAAEGGAAALLHLAAYYDFTGDPHVEYQRTNVEGTRSLLELSEGLGLERFVFASSVAACDFPRPGAPLDESSPPDGDHVYAVSKRAGEALVRAAQQRFPTAIVRFAAMFSDWCEYAPFYVFIDTWLSERWNARVLGGRGQSAVPYLHVRDACVCLSRLLDKRRELAPAEVLLVSPNGATTHEQLYRAVTAAAHGAPRRAIKVPKPLATVGLHGRDWLGRMVGRRPFERPWMARMIDLRLDVDARSTHSRLGWWPRPRLDVVRRMPFLIENLRSEPGTWVARNEATLHSSSLPPQLLLLRLLEEHDETIFAAFTARLLDDPLNLPHYAGVPEADHAWNHRMLLRSLEQSVRIRERSVFRTYCRDLAERRVRQGFQMRELEYAIATFGRVCREVLAADRRAAAQWPKLDELLSVTLEFGLDAVEEVYEELGVSSEEVETDAERVSATRDAAR